MQMFECVQCINAQIVRIGNINGVCKAQPTDYQFET